MPGRLLLNLQRRVTQTCRQRLAMAIRPLEPEMTPTSGAAGHRAPFGPASTLAPLGSFRTLAHRRPSVSHAVVLLTQNPCAVRVPCPCG